ncbi:MAG: flavodoxin domain-containing protein [Pseudomonadota bacterium]
MRAVKISDKVWWVGAIDWTIRDFHGYSTNRGTTYNAYLIMADKITLIDTVKAPFKDEMMSRIAQVVDPKKIDYIVSNHSEMDHSGSLPQVIKEVNPERVFASAMGKKALADHFSLNEEITAVSDGENLSLGNANLTFYETRMLHWPDSMMTYFDADKLMFSQDGFGMHLASSERFDDELDEALLKHEAAKYYANILTPYSGLIKKLLDRVAALNLSIKIVAPDHGPVWRTKIDKVLKWYSEWAEQKPTNKAVIAFDTMWQSTDRMARSIADGISSAQGSAKVMPIRASHRSEVATELIDAGAFIVGSPTINNQMFPTVADVLTYVKGLKFQNLMGAAFGSYGWSGEGVKLIQNELSDMKVDIVADSINVKYVPSDEDLKKCFDMGKLIGEKLSNAS